MKLKTNDQTKQKTISRFSDECFKREIPIIPGPRNTDSEITKCIKEFLINSGWQAERINTTGRMIDKSKVNVDSLGFQRKIGSMEWIPGTGTKGSADISATINGMSVKIEIKIGKDRQSEHQKKYQDIIERAGGVYIIARDFDGFIEWYDNFIQTI